jgi:hypothetical protein
MHPAGSVPAARRNHHDALIQQAGGSASVFGHSSGATLGLKAVGTNAPAKVRQQWSRLSGLQSALLGVSKTWSCPASGLREQVAS